MRRAGDQELFLQLVVGGTPLSPLQRIDSVAYACNAVTSVNVAGGGALSLKAG